MKKLLLTLLFAGMSIFSFAAENIITIPYKQDPPISVDGALNDWSDAQVGIIKVEGKKNLLEKSGPVPTAKDCSATFYFSWKPGGLYMAAEVKDDKCLQMAENMGMFDGDHIELFLDLAPNEKDSGASFGKKQFQLGISPGNFSNLKPEIYAAYPVGKKLSNSICAAEKTADGWNVEAFISWKDLGCEETILRNKVIGLTAWVSDADVDGGNTLRPEHILTTGKPAAQFRNRADMTPAVFTDSNGKHNAVIASSAAIKLENITVESSSFKDIEFEIDNISAFLNPVLRFNANLRSKDVFGGYARIMHIYVNGKELTQYNLLKPENDYYGKSGNKGQIFEKGRGYLVPYTKDGKAGNLQQYTKRFFSAHYNMHDFALDLTGLLKVGKNKIRVKSTLEKKYPIPLDLTNLKISFEVVKVRKTRKAAPTGKIPVIKLKNKIPLPDIVNAGSSVFEFMMKDGKYIVRSRFSTPDGKWVSGSNKYFKHQRTFEKKDELIHVKDTFTNLTNENLPLMQQHTVKVPSPDTSIHLNGIMFKSGKNIRRSLGNHSVFAGRGVGGGVGLYAFNPEFQIHCGTFIPEPQYATLCDDQFVLPPGKTYTQEFLIVPLEKGKYYDFVNVVRRYLNINRTLDGPSTAWAETTWQELFYNRLDIYNINIIVADLATIGRTFLTSPNIPIVKAKIAKLRKVRPQARIARYFHSQIESDDTAKWQEGKLLLKNGKQALYGKKPLFLNLEGTGYSKMMESALDDILDNWDVDGIYWDEFAYSGVDYHYGEPWDQYSADIHPVTHKIVNLKSSCWLLQRPWKNRMADKIKAKGKFLIANGGDAMMGEFANKIEATFTETQFDSNGTRVHFNTPIFHANSEHMDRSKFSEYYDKFLAALNYGCYFTYNWVTQPHTGPIYHTVTDHLYPSTPMEIHEGYLIAKERIVTNRSGYFGWEDNSEHQIYVYDYTGREVKNHKMKTVKLNGHTYSEIRLPQDWSAIIVRKK